MDLPQILLFIIFGIAVGILGGFCFAIGLKGKK